MRKIFKEVKGVLVEKSNLAGLVEAGKMTHRAFTTDIQPINISPIVMLCSEPRPIPAPRRKRNFLKVMEEEFANNSKAAKQYLKMLRQLEDIPESDSEIQVEKQMKENSLLRNLLLLSKCFISFLQNKRNIFIVLYRSL